jgi:hypothetical protein
MPRPSKNLRLARPWVEPVDPPHSLTLRQKSKHLMQLPTTSYPYGYNGNQHGSSTSVKSHFLLPIPGWAVKTCHCTHHAKHYSATDHPQGRIRRVSYPEIPRTWPYPFTIDPPRPGLDQLSVKQGSKACMSQDSESFHRLILYVTMVSGDGRPFPEHVATATSTTLDKTLLLRHPPVSLPPLDPIKGQAGDSTREEGGRTSKSQSPSHRRRSTSQAISFVLSLFLSET